MDKTFLSVKELSLKLNVSEKTVYRMINDHSIPFAIKIGGQWRFNTEKIDKWIATRKRTRQGRVQSNHRINVVEALEKGLIVYRAHGQDRDELLNEILGLLNIPSNELLFNIKKKVLYNESIISSSLCGVSLMAPEIDESHLTEESRLVIAFLEKPMNFKAIDGVETEVVVLLLAANRTEQLVLKTRLQRLFMEPRFLSMLKAQLPRRDLIEVIVAMEKEFLS